VLLPAGRRDAVCAALQARGIAATPWWSGCHRGLDWTDPAAETALDLKARGLSLPIHPGLRPDDVDRVAAAVRSVR